VLPSTSNFVNLFFCSSTLSTWSRSSPGAAQRRPHLPRAVRVVLRRALELLHGQRDKRLAALVLLLGWLLKSGRIMSTLEQHKSNFLVFITASGGVFRTRAFGQDQSTHLDLSYWRRPLVAALHEPALGSMHVALGSSVLRLASSTLRVS
jgi:hypothetical protein